MIRSKQPSKSTILYGTLIVADDFLTWLRSTGFVLSSDRVGRIYAHISVARLAWHLESGVISQDREIDHLNGNKFDLRRNNLRSVTHAENCANRPKSTRNSSGFLGVSWLTRERRWQAAIRLNGKTTIIGLFTDPIEAARRRDEYARTHSDFQVCMNFPLAGERGAESIGRAKSNFSSLELRRILLLSAKTKEFLDRLSGRFSCTPSGYVYVQFHLGRLAYCWNSDACLTKEQVIDHRNGKQHDVRPENLRLTSQKMNVRNQKKRQNTKSGFKGVCWSAQQKKWRARIRVDGQDMHLGFHENVEDAARAYDAGARKFFGEFAALNFPLSLSERQA